MNPQILLIYISCIIGIIIVCKIFIVPIKWIFRIIANSILGSLLLYLVNAVGANFRSTYRHKCYNKYFCWNFRDSWSYFTYYICKIKM